MNYFAPRTCTEIPEIGSHDDRYSSMSLEEFRGNSCFVLLGPPGAGKTEAFKREATQEEGHYVTARDFITFENRPEWHGTTLFIDGLDEMRAGKSDQRTPFDQIRAKLQDLECPRFRLSCREADWFGANDRDHLRNVSPDGRLKVLRLDPLSDENILKILRCNHNVESPEKFIASAHEKGIHGLLTNPQSLVMLASAVADGNWPETRTETFDLACRKLLEEHNEEHQLADLDAVGIQELLDTAGKLCTIQLLSGQTGYIRIGNEENCGYINLKQIDGEKQHSLRKVLSSKLFESQDKPHITPVHRQVAEFLGGRYLSKSIQEGLPVRRILALMTGYDGGIVSELRGLSAWLAAHSPESRKEIIERDPLGIILYGDIRRLSTDEKHQILNHIADETKKNPWYTQLIGHDSHLEYLATPDVREYFRNVLTDPARNHTQQSLVRFLLETLQHGSSIPELADVLLEIVRDDSWPLDVRDSALLAFIQQQRNDEHIATRMVNLLEDVNAGSVSDPDDQLLGILLRELYPGTLSASDIWKYFRTPKNSSPLLFGSYRSFWTGIVERSTTIQFNELIDKFIERSDQFLKEYRANRKQFRWFSEVCLTIWTKFLGIKRCEVSLDALFNWLWIALDPEFEDPYYEEEKIEISRWMNENPKIIKTVFSAGMKHGFNSRDIYSRIFTACDEIAHPPDFGLWCLEQAIAVTDKEHAEFFLCIVVASIKNRDEEISLEIVEKKLEDLPLLKQKFKNLLAKYDSVSEQLKDMERTENDEKDAKNRQQRIIDYIKSYEKALRENRCPSRLLHDLARVYFGEDANFPGYVPADRLRNLLDGNEDLVNIILKAFRESVVRHDLPDEAEIIQLRKNDKAHYLALPFLAGIEELFLNDSESGEIPIAEKRARQALAFYFNAPLPVSFSGPHPFWYRKLLTENPDMVLDILILSTRSRTTEIKETISDLYELVFQNNQAEAAKLMALPLLKTFPVRCTKQQLHGLNYLLRVALLHCDEELLLKSVNKKLSYPSMNIAQRACWLAAGLIISSSNFIEELEAYLAGRERRVRNLLVFVKGFPDELIRRLDVPVLEFLIRTIGHSSPFAWFSPKDVLGLMVEYGLIGTPDKPNLPSSEKSGWVGLSTEAGHLMHRLIQQLASIQSPSATKALKKLLSDHELHSWKQYLTDALRRQELVRREASFNHFSVNQVLETLDNNNPANAADLSALTIDILTDLARNIRDGSTSDWRQYWRIENNKPQDPQHENECRNRLLSDLKKRFEQSGINASMESHYADSNRPDISIAHNEYKVPIEIKKSDHRELWSAIRTQLMAKYTRDPGTDGHGIYLVFWFGVEFCQLPGSGTRPQSAVELKERLIDSLTTDEQRKIPICVIDVAKPQEERT
jgi:ferritin